jgi:hypothetical protein
MLPFYFNKEYEFRYDLSSKALYPSRDEGNDRM